MPTFHATITGGSGSGNYEQYEVFAIHAYAPPTGYHFGWWSYGDGIRWPGSPGPGSPDSYCALIIDGWATVYWVKNTYTVNYYSGAGGHVSGTTPQTVEYGSYTSSVTAIPDSGYHFTQWSDGNGNATRSDVVTSAWTKTAYFAANEPTVTSLDVTEGGSAGGTTVVLTGTYFTGATSVKFGATEVASYVVDSAVQITAVTPAHAIGLVDVSVTTAAGTGTKLDAFTFNQPSKSASGSVTPAGAITQKDIGHHVSGSLAPSGELQYSHGSAYAISAFGTVTPTGELFIYKLRPKTFFAPYVPTTYNTQ
jgi:hypothetical protein